MMAVVVDDGNVIHDALQVKAAADARKFGQAFTDQVARNIQIERDGCGSSRISDVVHPWRMRQTEKAEVFVFKREAKLTVEAFQFYIADDQVCLARSAIRDDWALHIGKNGLHVRFVEAQNRGAIERDAVHKLNERVLDIRKRAVLVEVLAIDGGDD